MRSRAREPRLMSVQKELEDTLKRSKKKRNAEPVEDVVASESDDVKL